MTNEEKFEEIKNIEKGLGIFEKALNTRTMGESDGVQFANPQENGDNNLTINNEGGILDEDIIGSARIKRTIMKVFPPYNESESDANEWSTRWAHREGVENGAQKLAFYKGRCYVIGKYESADLKYQIEGTIDKKDLENAINEVKKHAKNVKYGVQRNSDRLADVDKGRTSDGGNGRGISNIATQHKRESGGVQQLGENQIGEWGIQGNSSRSDERNSQDRQTAGINSDIQFSSPVASAETETKNDIKISSNKAKNYYDRYARTAKKDIGKMFGIPGARIGALDGNFDTLAGEYFHTGKISESSKEALFEKAWKEGVIIDDTNKEFAKELRKDLKSSKLYISPEEAHDIPDFGIWSRSQIGNMYISTKNGYSIDSKYSELSQQYPDLFPDDIIAPSDQLLRIAEVMERLKPLEYTLEEREAEFKEDYRKEFMKGIDEFEKRLSDVSRYEKARELSDVQNAYGRDELTVEEAELQLIKYVS